VRYRLLNTTELARVVHQQLLALREGRQPELDGLEPDFYANLGHDMLVRLINAWGVNPKRVFARSLHANRQVQVITGIDAINFFVNGQGFAPSTNEVGPPPRSAALGHGNSQPRQRIPQSSAASGSWELTDESAGGYALAKSGAQAEPVRVGDILASRPGDGNAGWEIGSVRWVRTTGVDSIEIGVQRMAPGASAVAVMPPEAAQDRYFLALALPQVSAMKQPATLVTHRGFYKAGNILYLDDGYRLRKIKVATLLELSGSFERFQYEFVTD
jgi:cyclic-di-GMP-binding protein